MVQLCRAARGPGVEGQVVGVDALVPVRRFDSVGVQHLCNLGGSLAPRAGVDHAERERRAVRSYDRVPAPVGNHRPVQVNCELVHRGDGSGRVLPVGPASDRTFGDIAESQRQSAHVGIGFVIAAGNDTHHRRRQNQKSRATTSHADWTLHAPVWFPCGLR